MDNRTALLLFWRSKHTDSNSGALGKYLFEKLKAQGVQVKALIIPRTLKTDAGLSGLLAAVNAADIVILASPVYCDCLPDRVIRTLELVRDHRLMHVSEKQQRFAAIINCGFPDIKYTQLAIAMCRRFAAESGFGWAGAVGLSGGEILMGQSPVRLGWLGRNVVRGLDMAALALGRGQDIPESAIGLLARPVVPRWCYMIWISLVRWRSSLKYGVFGKLKARPFEVVE